MSPSRRRDVLPLVEPKPPAEHPLADLGLGKARKGRRRRAPKPESAEDARDALLATLLKQVQSLNRRVAELESGVLVVRIQGELRHRRIVALEERSLEARWEPAGDVAAVSDGESAAEPPRTP